MPRQTTSPSANIELLRAGFDEFNAGDLDACVARAAAAAAPASGRPAHTAPVRLDVQRFSRRSEPARQRDRGELDVA
jgi:hypothetical protein